MRKLLLVALLLSSCKSTSHKCDAYGSQKKSSENLVAKK